MMLKEIQNYWQGRADSYAQEGADEFNGDDAIIWQKIFKTYAPASFDGLKVLDVGCGPGAFSIILSKLGAKVSALDYTPKMIENAQQNAQKHNVKIKFFQGDAQELPFDSCSFDMVVSKNLTWNLSHPEKAYLEWYRVLKTGGRMLNFDANWYLPLFDDGSLMGESIKIPDYSEICPAAYKIEEIVKDFPISKVLRPDWDEKVLSETGFKIIECEKKVFPKFFGKERFYVPTFLIIGEK